MEEILVISRKTMEEWLNIPDWVIKHRDDIAIISIRSSFGDKRFPLGVSNLMKHGLDLQFDDIEHQPKGDNKYLFNDLEDHAKQIVDFSLKAANDGIKTFVVHCDAGISRSGAVGLFLTRFFGMEEAEFKRKHPLIAPNAHVIGTLQEVSGMNADYVKWCMENWGVESNPQ